MDKQKFISTLKRRLARLPRAEVAERVNFYSEMIDDRIEEGLSEHEAVAEIGPIDKIVAQIKAERVPRGVADGFRPASKLRGREIAVMIIGSPVWIPLLIAAAAVIFALYAVMWSLVLVLWAVELPFFIMAFISKYLLIGCMQTTRLALTLTNKGAALLRRRRHE